MDYIINPLWFYAANVCGALNFIALILALLTGVGAIASFLLVAENADNSDDEEYTKKAIGYSKVMIGMFVTSLLLFVFIPSGKTIKEMAIANVMTKQNIQSSTDFTQDQIGKIIDKITEASSRKQGK